MKTVHLVEIPVEKLNLEDRRFCLSPVVHFEPLLRSLAEVGLVIPPVVRETDRGLILVSGWKRVLACKQLNLTPLLALVASPEASDLEIFIRCLEENLSQRPLSLAEKIEAVNKLSLFGAAEGEIIRKFMPRLGFPATPHFYQFFLRLARSQDFELKKFLHATEIPTEALEILVSWSEQERSLLLPYLGLVSYSRRREIIFNLSAITLREKLPASEVLGSPEARILMEAEGMSARKKAEALAEWLRRRRYPLLTAWEKRIERIKKEIGWPKEAKLVSDPTFEEESLFVTFSFRSSEEFLKRLEQLRHVAGKPEFTNLFRRSL